MRVFSGLLLAYIFTLLCACDSLFSPLHKDWTDSSNNLKQDKVDEVITQLRQEKVSYLVSESPGLGNWLLHRLQDVDINNKEDSGDNRLNEAKLVFELQKMAFWQEPPSLYRDLYAKKGWPESLQKLCLKWVNHSQLVDWVLTPLEGEVFAQILFASNLATKESRTKCMSFIELSKVYQSISLNSQGSRHLQSVILQLLWLHKAQELDDNSFQFLPIALSAVNSSGDLIRLIGDKNKQVATASVRLVAELLPVNAIHALRFHLIQTPDDDLKIEILKAMQGYGVQTRAYHAQLRQLLSLTESQSVKQAIQDLLDKTNGH